jgi:hypothetical protein
VVIPWGGDLDAELEGSKKQPPNNSIQNRHSAILVLVWMRGRTMCHITASSSIQTTRCY